MMKRTICAALIALLSWCGAAFAQGGMMPGPGTMHSTGGGSPTIGGAGAITANCGFGANPCVITASATVTTGVVAIMIGVLNSGTSGTITDVSVCGTSLTIDITRTIANNEYGAAFARGSVTGGTCTISLSFSASGSIADMGAAWVTMGSLNSATPDTSCTGFFNVSQASPYPCTGGLTVTGSGFGVVGFWDNLTTLPTNGGSLTVDASAGNASNRNIGIAHVTATCTAAQCQYNADGFGQTSVYGESFH